MQVNPAPDWLKATLRPLNLHTPCSVPFPPISIPHPVLAGRLRLFVENWKKLTQDTWVLNSIQGFKISFSTDPYPRIGSEQGGGLHITGDSISPGQRCNNPSTISPREFLLHNFHSSQEGWRSPPYNKLERLEQVYPPYPFQDGGYTIPEGYCSSGGFHDQIRSQGCLFFNPCTSFPLEVFEFPVEARDFPVHLPSFWSLQCSPNIHKSNEASHYLPQISGNTDGRLSGRYANSSPDQGGTPQMEVNCPGFNREPGFSHQLQQVRIRTHPESNISRFSNRYNKHADQTAKRKGQPGSSGGSEAPGGSASISKTASPPDRSFLLDPPSDPSSSPPLQRPSASEASSPQERGVRRDSPSLSGSKRRPVMVDSESESSKWTTPGERSAIPPDRDRCISDGLGGSLQGGADRWSLDGRGESTPHKLFGAVRSYVCNSSLCQGQKGLGSPCAHGQHHSCGICQSYGRNEVIEALLHDKESLGLVSSATSNHSSIPHPREAERGSRPTIKICCGPSRLDAGSSNIPSNQFSLGSSTGGFVCIQDYQTASTFFQLETRPTSGGSGCIQTDVDRVYRICQRGPIGRCVQYTLQQGATIVLITPIWPGQPWYPTLFPLLLDNPRLLPLYPDLLRSPQGLKIPLPKRANQLVAWYISGNRTKVQESQTRLLPSCLPRGEDQQPKTITLPGECGSNGAFSRAPIQFLPL